MWWDVLGEVCMKRSDIRKGFTVTQLIIVLAIVGVLISLAIPSYMAADKAQAQASFSNEVANLMQAQRNRAMSTNLAMLLVFDNSNQTIQPMVGSNSTCESTPLPIAYPNEENAARPVMLSLKKDNQARTSEFSSSTKYVDAVIFSAGILAPNGTRTARNVLVCFQANGSVRYFEPGTLAEIPTANGLFSFETKLKKGNAGIGNAMALTLNRFGSMISYTTQ